MKVAVIGGDKRMLFAAKAFLDENCEVMVAGFDDLLSLCEIKVRSVEEAALSADMIVLPVRPLKDGSLSAPFSAVDIPVPELLSVIGEKPVFSGCAGLLEPFARGRVFDYASREDFTYRNAELTAEGAIGIIISEYEGSVYGSDILVFGYGRIGKLLSSYLKCMGARVTVAARKLSDRSLAELSGLETVGFDDIRFGDHDIIFNTVPAPVAGKSAVDAMRDDVFIVDLASSPGGIDHASAGRRGLSCIHALSLPGKTAPQKAGMIIKDTICTMIKEENGGKDYVGLRDDGLLLHLG